MLSGRGMLCFRSMADVSASRNDFHESGFRFVNTELDTGLTFARIALEAKGARRADKLQRNRVNARKAYDSALHFLSTTSFSADEARMIHGKIVALKSGLEKLGETL